MKLLFPFFVSLILQSQVNTEFLVLKKCLMGFGRCKDHCTMDEKEIDKCKKKKCCVGSQVIQLIKNYIQVELSHILEKSSQEHLKFSKNSNPVIQAKYHIISILPKIESIGPSANINTITVNSATSTVTPADIKYAATSTKRGTTKRRKSIASSKPAAAAGGS